MRIYLTKQKNIRSCTFISMPFNSLIMQLFSYEIAFCYKAAHEPRFPKVSFFDMRLKTHLQAP